MEKSNGTMIMGILLVFGLGVYSIYFGQISFAEGVELKTVGKGAISCGNGEEVSGGGLQDRRGRWRKREVVGGCGP